MSQELLDAVESGDIELFRKLINKGDDINYIDAKTGNSALHIAILSGQKKLINEIISVPNVNLNITNQKGNSPLHILMRADDRQPEIYALLEKGADPSIKNAKGETSLLIAIASEINENALLILNYKNSSEFLEARDGSGRTALGLAVEQGNSKIIDVLLEKAANPLTIDKHGNTLLFSAVSENASFPTFKKIFSYYQNSNLLNHQNKFGQTVLHAAIESAGPDKSKIIKKILDQPHINLQLKNYRGHNVVDHIAYMGDIESFEILITLKLIDLSKPEILERMCGIAAAQGRINFLKYLDSINHEVVSKNILAKRFLDKDEDYQAYIENILQQFNTSFGKIDEEGGAICHAQKKEEYQEAGKEFNGYIASNIVEFMEAIKERADLHLSKKLTLQLSITGVHWKSAYLEIENGTISISIFDSLGVTPKEKSLLYNEIAEVISGVEICAGTDKRQYSKLGCSVFSITDVHLLAKINSYLEEKYHTSGLFNYLKDHCVVSTKFLIEDRDPNQQQNYYVVNYVKYPLALLRSTQTMQASNADSKLPYWIENVSQKERQLKTPSQQRTLEESALKYVQKIDDKQINLRLEHKLNKLLTKVREYLLSKDSIQEIKDAISKVSLDGFKEETKKLREQMHHQPPTVKPI